MNNNDDDSNNYSQIFRFSRNGRHLLDRRRVRGEGKGKGFEQAARQQKQRKETNPRRSV